MKITINISFSTPNLNLSIEFSFLVSDIFLANLVLICHQSSQQQQGNPNRGKIKGFKILLIEEHRKHHLKASKLPFPSLLLNFPLSHFMQLV